MDHRADNLVRLDDLMFSKGSACARAADEERRDVDNYFLVLPYEAKTSDQASLCAMKAGNSIRILGTVLQVILSQEL